MQKVIIRDKAFRLSISAGEINSAVEAVAQKINFDLKDKNPLFIAVLNGSFMFAADLMKKLDIECEITFVKVSSYAGTGSTGTVREIIGLQEHLEGRTVIILEDIIDTGNTIEFMLNLLKDRGAVEIKIASLLYKPAAFYKLFQPDYVGIEVANDFLVGYGLDYSGGGRNLPEIFVLDEDRAYL